MKSQGCLVSVGLIALALSMGAGCKKDEPPKPDPATQTQGKTPPKVNTRNPAPNKTDPQAMKDYRLDVCYYGTLSLRQARDAYLASLGKDEPSEKKIPSFGTTPVAAPPPGAAKPPKPGAAPSGGASASPGGAEPRRPDFMRAMPYERNARACSIAVSLKDPAMGDVDVAMAAYAPVAAELSKDVVAASQYYQHEEYKKDSFAKGKELDKKLRENFAKLDEAQEKLHTALTAWRKDHPTDTSKMEEGEKLGRVTFDDARDIYLLVLAKKADGEAWKGALDKLDKSVEALKAFATAHPTDAWGRVLTTPLEAFVKTAKESKITPDKTFDADSVNTLVTNFVGIIEGRQRAVSRGAMNRPQIMPQVPPNAGSPTQPAPVQPQPQAPPQ
jgi:Protein of unknown function (DUF3829)